MHLKDLLISVTRLLELSVDVGSDDEIWCHGTLDPALNDMEAFVGDGSAVEVGAVTVEAPAKGRVAAKVGRVGRLDKGEPQAGVGGIGLPEALVAAKIRQAGVHPHAGAGGDDKGLGLSDRCCCPFKHG